jgi:methionine sulfoxide reductase heme-binding subunit
MEIAQPHKTGKKDLTFLQILIHAAGWIPLAQIVYGLLTNDFTANPIQRVEQVTGDSALRLLLFSLACTPLAVIFGWREMVLRRRALGNYGFMYAALHLVTFVAVDYGLNFAAIFRDVGSKQYVIIGLIAFLLLLPLAATSSLYWMRRLGKKWKSLHRLVYLISPLVVVHFLLVVKGNVSRLSGNLSQPMLYAAIAALLLLMRVPMVKKPLIALRSRIVLLLRHNSVNTPPLL